MFSSKFGQLFQLAEYNSLSIGLNVKLYKSRNIEGKWFTDLVILKNIVLGKIVDNNLI